MAFLLQLRKLATSKQGAADNKGKNPVNNYNQPAEEKENDKKQDK